ncbi:MAG: glycosyltransferase family 2 protein [Candidatus Omnitrophota bacterium]
MKLSIIMPIYNEEATLKHIIEKILSVDIDKELIIVNDGSIDRSSQILDTIKNDSIKIIKHSHNQGKGSAIKTGLSCVTGDIVVIQDADLEYDPADYIRLVEPIVAGEAKVVYGSRFLIKGNSISKSYYAANRFLTFLTNLLHGSRLTDMETCYKVFCTDILKGLDLDSDGFEIEPELTIKALKKGYKIREVPIFYQARSYREGKKITWKDAIKTLLTIFRYKFR